MLHDLFKRAAFQAGWNAARAGVPFTGNPLTSGPLAQFARQWWQGWSEHVSRACRYSFVPKNSDCMEAFHA